MMFTMVVNVELPGGSHTSIESLTPQSNIKEARQVAAKKVYEILQERSIKAEKGTCSGQTENQTCQAKNASSQKSKSVTQEEATAETESKGDFVEINCGDYLCTMPT